MMRSHVSSVIFEELLEAGEAGVVDEHEHRAQGATDALHGGVHLRAVGDVDAPKATARSPFWLASSATRSAASALRSRTATAKPSSARSMGDGASDSRSAAGDDCRLSLVHVPNLRW